jgi:hypothetical protein
VRRRSVLVLSVLLLAAAPAAAAAACDERTDPLDRVRDADVVATAVARPGPTAFPGGPLVSAAAFRVERYDKGGAADEVRVQTSYVRVADGLALVPGQIAPLPGERWRLNLERRPGGLFATTTCLGSAVLGVPAPPPVVRSADRSVPVRRSNWRGVPGTGVEATLPLAAARRLRATRVLALGVVRGRRIVRTGIRRGGTWRVPPGVRRGDRVLLDTGDAFYGVRVR